MDFEFENVEKKEKPEDAGTGEDLVELKEVMTHEEVEKAKCPHCGEELVFDDGIMELYCSNQATCNRSWDVEAESYRIVDRDND